MKQITEEIRLRKPQVYFEADYRGNQVKKTPRLTRNRLQMKSGKKKQVYLKQITEEIRLRKPQVYFESDYRGNQVKKTPRLTRNRLQMKSGKETPSLSWNRLDYR